MYCNIIVTKPFDQVFTYETKDHTITEGQVVIVPFGKKLEVGIVWNINVVKPKYKIKQIIPTKTSL